MYSFIPNTLNCKTFYIDDFHWHYLLTHGLGYMFGIGPGHDISQYTLHDDNIGKHLLKKEGYYLQAEDAAVMHRVAQGMYHTWSTLAINHRRFPEHIQHDRLASAHIYNNPPSKQIVKTLENLVSWLKECEGFFIQ